MFIDQQGGREHVQHQLCQSRRSIDTLFRGGWGERSLVKTVAAWNVYVSEPWVLMCEPKFTRGLHESSSCILFASVAWNELICSVSCVKGFSYQKIWNVLLYHPCHNRWRVYFSIFTPLFSYLFSFHTKSPRYCLQIFMDVFLGISCFKKFWPPQNIFVHTKTQKKMLQQEHWAWGRHTKDILISLIFASSCPLSSILIISQHSLSEDVSNPKMHLEERGENYSKSEGVSFEVFSALGT